MVSILGMPSTGSADSIGSGQACGRVQTGCRSKNTEAALL